MIPALSLIGTDSYDSRFFASILSTCPDSVDEVLLESNGDWHTEDGKYGSASWKAANPNVPPPSARLLAGSNQPSRTATPEVRVKVDSPAVGGASAPANGGSSTPAPAPAAGPIEIFELSDSDDDDVHVPLKRAASVHRRSESALDALTSSVPPPSATPDPISGKDEEHAIEIDDSDDDDEVVPMSTNAKRPTSENDSGTNGTTRDNRDDQNGKRARETSPSRDQGIYKRTRTDTHQALPELPPFLSPWESHSPIARFDWSPLNESVPPRSAGPSSDPQSSGGLRSVPLPSMASSSRPTQPDNDTIHVKPYRPAHHSRPSNVATGSNGYGSYARPDDVGQEARYKLPSAHGTYPPLSNGHAKTAVVPSKPQLPPSSSYSKP